MLVIASLVAWPAAAQQADGEDSESEVDTALTAGLVAAFAACGTRYMATKARAEPDKAFAAIEPGVRAACRQELMAYGRAVLAPGTSAADTSKAFRALQNQHRRQFKGTYDSVAAAEIRRRKTEVAAVSVGNPAPEDGAEDGAPERAGVQSASPAGPVSPPQAFPAPAAPRVQAQAFIPLPPPRPRDLVPPSSVSAPAALPAASAESVPESELPSEASRDVKASANPPPGTQPTGIVRAGPGSGPGELPPSPPTEPQLTASIGAAATAPPQAGARMPAAVPQTVRAAPAPLPAPTETAGPVSPAPPIVVQPEPAQPKADAATTGTIVAALPPSHAPSPPVEAPSSEWHRAPVTIGGLGAIGGTVTPPLPDNVETAQARSTPEPPPRPATSIVTAAPFSPLPAELAPPAADGGDSLTRIARRAPPPDRLRLLDAAIGLHRVCLARAVLSVSASSPSPETLSHVLRTCAEQQEARVAREIDVDGSTTPDVVQRVRRDVAEVTRIEAVELMGLLRGTRP